MTAYGAGKASRRNQVLKVRTFARSLRCCAGAKPGAPLGGEDELLRQLAQQGLQCDPTTQVRTRARGPRPRDRAVQEAC